MNQNSTYTELMVARVCNVGRMSVLQIVASLIEIALVVETLWCGEVLLMEGEQLSTSFMAT
jgi:hypothetical protein